MQKTKLKKFRLLSGFVILFMGLAITAINSNVTTKIHDFVKGILVGLVITLVISSFILDRLEKQKNN